MKLPDFLIVGAMKAGTTTLATYLHNLPKIFMPENEVHFFDNLTLYKQGTGAYSAFFKSANEEQIIGEKTPTYSHDIPSPKRIYETIPKVKIIWIFREPVSRAYSNYWHAVKNGVENLNFKEAWENENERIKNDWFKAYVQRSIYIVQIERYLEFFDISQMHFILQEDLKNNREAVLMNLCGFIGVQYDKKLSTLNIKSNITRIPKSKLLQFYGRKIFNNTKVYSLIWRLNQKKNPGYPPMDSKLNTALKKYFLPYNKALAELINKDLSHWNQ